MASFDRLLFQFRRNPGIWILAILVLLIVIGIVAERSMANNRRDKLLQAQRFLQEEKADELIQFVSNVDPNKKDAEFQDYFAKATDLKDKLASVKFCGNATSSIRQLFLEKKLKEVKAIVASCKKARTHSGVSLLVDPDRLLLDSQLELLRTTFEINKALSGDAIRQFLSDYFPDVPPHQGDLLEVSLDKKKIHVTFRQEKEATTEAAGSFVVVEFKVTTPPPTYQPSRQNSNQPPSVDSDNETRRKQEHDQARAQRDAMQPMLSQMCRDGNNDACRQVREWETMRKY